MSSLYFDIEDNQWPIVYHRDYNISFFGLERCHVFDAHKWGNIIKRLKTEGMITDAMVVEPREAETCDLMLVHTKKYLKSLKCSLVVARIAEVPCLSLVPNFLLQSHYLKPMRLQTGGSILAGKLALDRGWAVNVGGGFHHCSADRGGGFCPYADITLMLRYLFHSGFVHKAMIVDLDAHQGNGYQRDFAHDRRVYMMDMFNQQLYPHDSAALAAVRKPVYLVSKMEELDYLPRLVSHLKEALEEFSPDIAVYNAGTDILHDDPLGRMRVSPRGVIKRDEIVFRMFRERQIPIVMLLSGGYSRSSAGVIAESILNLRQKGLIGPTEKTFPPTRGRAKRKNCGRVFPTLNGARGSARVKTHQASYKPPFKPLRG